MKKWLAALALFFMSTASWAVSASFAGAPAIQNKTDLSITYLDQVFGTVGTVLTGTTGQMLGHLFYKFNEGILIVVALWLVYTVFTIAVRSAMEGSFMGQNKNVALTILRIALGVSLLIPSSTTGYSLLQNIMMEVVVQGVGLADETWDYGLDYINNGGYLWQSPEAITKTSNAISPDTLSGIMISDKTASEQDEVSAQQIFANLVCMYASADANSMTYDPQQDDAGNRIVFPGSSSKSNDVNNSYCGSVSWNIQSVCSGVTLDDNIDQATATNNAEAECAIGRQSVAQLVENLQPAAQEYYCSMLSDTSDSYTCNGTSYNADNVTTDMVNYFFMAYIDYMNSIYSMAQLKQTGDAADYKNFISQAEKEGWLSAGRYYWDLSQIQSHYDTVSDLTNYSPAVSPYTLSRESSPTSCNSPGNCAYLAGIKTFDYYTPVYTDVQNFETAQGSGGSTESASYSKDGLYWALDAIGLGMPIEDIYGLIKAFNADQVPDDPILFLHRIGETCFAIAYDIWFGMGALYSILMLATSVCRSQWDPSNFFSAAIEWVKPLFMGLAAAMCVVGAILGYYVPLYPYMLFTFGVIGWIIAVIEAMVAAPLVCFGLTHPEGHDFLGEAKQAVMLALGIFLRPVLMIFGLIAGMILSYVSLRILLYTFSGVISDLFYQGTPQSGAASGDVLKSVNTFWPNAKHDIIFNSDAFGGFFASLALFPMMLAIFTGIVYVVTTQCFSLIYALPDNILRWIGAPTTPSASAEMAQKVQGIASQAGSTAADVGKMQGDTLDKIPGKMADRKSRSIAPKAASKSDDSPKSTGPGGAPPAA